MKHTEEIISVENPWFENWFDSPYYHKLYAHRDHKEAERFIDALLKKLQPEDNSAMLDLGCGAGRHSMHLASHGYQVTGIDLSQNSIKEAAMHQSSSLEFIRHDMRQPFGSLQFDYIFNFFTSFGYFDDERENFDVIFNISAALNPGGTVVIDYLNENFAEQNMVMQEEKSSDNVHFKIDRWKTPSFFYKKIKVNDAVNGYSQEFTEQVACLSLSDFNLLFALNNIYIEAVYGDYDLNPFNRNTSPRLIIIAKKKEAS